MNQIPLLSSPGTRSGDMLYRTLGRTGERVSVIGMGGFHIAQHGLTEDESIRLVRTAIDRGITFMDNSWDYNDGQSELRMGKALKDGYRQKVFLMTKIDGRTKDLARKQIETSLQRLQTDHIDLIQHHEVIRFDDPDRIFAEGGANEAVLEAQQSRQDPLHRFYRTQRSSYSSLHAESCRRPRLPLRYGTDAAERDGRSLPKFRSPRCARAGATADRSARHEVDGRRRDPEKQDCIAGGMSTLRHEPSHFGSDYRNRPADNSGSGNRSGKNI